MIELFIGRCGLLPMALKYTGKFRPTDGMFPIPTGIRTEISLFMIAQRERTAV